MPAGPSCDILRSLRASGLSKRLFHVAVSQRSRQATWRPDRIPYYARLIARRSSVAESNVAPKPARAARNVDR